MRRRDPIYSMMRGTMQRGQGRDKGLSPDAAKASSPLTPPAQPQGYMLYRGVNFGGRSSGVLVGLEDDDMELGGK